MKFVITINCDNSAFADDDAEAGNDAAAHHAANPEVARILRDLAKRLDASPGHGKLKDANGNTVGSFEYID